MEGWNLMKNSYRIITKFSYKNKQYFIILSNENKIAYVVYENKKVITDIDKQDLNDLKVNASIWYSILL